jgi:hypothetical protein
MCKKKLPIQPISRQPSQTSPPLGFHCKRRARALSETGAPLGGRGMGGFR